MRLLAIDPGFAALGWAVLAFGEGGVDIVACGTIKTEKQAKKRKLHSGSDDGRRIDQIVDLLAEVHWAHRPSDRERFHLGAYELPSAAKGARAAHALGLAHVIARLSLRGACSSLVELSVEDARSVAAGRPKAKEPDAHAAIKSRWPRLELATPHELDAVAVGLGALETPVGRALAGGV